MAGTLKTPTFASSTGRQIKRRPAIIDSFAVNTVLADCDPIDISQLAGAAIKIPASVTGITCHGCDTSDGTFTAIHGSDGTAAALTGMTALDWYDLFAACFAFSYLKIQSVGASGNAKLVSKT